MPVVDQFLSKRTEVHDIWHPRKSPDEFNWLLFSYGGGLQFLVGYLFELLKYILQFQQINGIHQILFSRGRVNPGRVQIAVS